MKAPLLTMGITILVLTTSLQAGALFDRFIRADGAISVLMQGNFVDPYFANKALIIAWEAGLDVSEVTHNWLAWLLPRQRADGGFDRFCADGALWRACKPADADDSTAATFLHLNALYSRALQRQKRVHGGAVADTPGHAAARAMAAKKAEQMLQGLRTPRGTYRAFADKPIEFLMDNTEVYASFVATGQQVQASQLKQALERYFSAGSEWRPANEAYERYEFYPSALAPTYRWHTGLTSSSALEQEFVAWTKRWGTAWLTRTQDEYAWGLVAWGARNVKEQHWIRCWRHKHHMSDRSRGWTVVDEAVDLGLVHLGVEPVAQSCESVLDKK
jgi:hypothetical protein